MPVSKLYSGTSKTKAGQGGLVRVALFWKSHCATCSPAGVILYHLNGSCKRPIASAEMKWLASSRPLTEVSSDADDLETLTPNQFIIGRGKLSLPPLHNWKRNLTIPGVFVDKEM